MLKYFFGAILICTLDTSCYAQQPKILYYLPDSVEVRINQYLVSQKSGKNYYCILERLDKDTTQIYVSDYTSKGKRYTESWVFNTNRFVEISNRKLPLILDYDYLYSTLDTSKVGKYGQRSIDIVRQMPIIHSFKIKYTKYYILNESNKPIGFSNYQSKE
jgi:hypothetical protein